MIKQEHNRDKRHKKPLIKFGKRLKKRHLLIEFLFTQPKDEQFFATSFFAPRNGDGTNAQTLYNCLLRHFVKYWGEHGRAILMQKPSFKIIYLNTATHMCIVQIPHKAQSMFTSILPFITRLNKGDGEVHDESSASSSVVNVSLRVLHISGTIRSLKQVAMAYHNKWMREVQVHHAQMIRRFEGQDFISFDDEDDGLESDSESEREVGAGDDDDGDETMGGDKIPKVKADVKFVNATIPLLTLASSSTSAD